jgi:hypothetical protein
MFAQLAIEESIQGRRVNDTVSNREEGGKDGKRKQAREPRPEQAVCFEFGFILELPETNTTSELLGEDGMVWRPEKSGLDGERGEGGNCCLAAWVIGHLE